MNKIFRPTELTAHFDDWLAFTKALRQIATDNISASAMQKLAKATLQERGYAMTPNGNGDGAKPNGSGNASGNGKLNGKGRPNGNGRLR